MNRWHAAWPPSAAWPWIIAGTVLLTAAALAWGATPLWRRQAAVAEQLAHTRQLALAARPAAARDSSVEAAARWRERLPAASERDARIAALVRQALELGIALPATGQRVSEDHDAGVDSHQIELTARGSYVELRRFVDEALRADPALALDQIHLARSGTQASELDASLRFVMLQRSAPEPGLRP